MRAEVLVTRPEEQAGELCAALARRGIGSVVVPTVAVDRHSTAADVDALLERGLRGAAWLVVTSANGATALVDRIAATGRTVPAGVRVAAVGPATARVLATGGLRVDYVPVEYRTAAIAGGLGDVSGRRIVLACADAATPELRDALVERGAEVVELVAYRTIEGPPASRDALHVALSRDLAGAAFASGSSVRGLLRLASPTDRQRARAVPAFCIGPVTAETARRFGFDIAAVASPYTSDGLAEVIAGYVHRGEG